MARRLFAAALLASASLPVAAQNVVQSAPVQTAPRIENFSIATPTPTPSPTPTQQPAPVAPPPVVRTAPSPTAAPTPTATPRTTSTPTASVTPTPAPTPAAAPVAPPPAAMPTTAPAVPLPTATAAAPGAESGPPWLALIAGALILLAAAVVWTLRRRRPVPVEAPPAPVPAPAAPRQAPARPVPAPARAIVTTLRPHEMWTLGPDAFLKFDLVVTNHGAETADAIRVAVALTSAGPDLAQEIAGWQSGADFGGAAAPITLRPGESYVLGGELKLPGDLMRINEVADRAMIVPVAMVALRWRGGLSVRVGGDAFIIGTGAGSAAKLGPIWVDRAGQRFAKLDARRFEPR